MPVIFQKFYKREDARRNYDPDRPLETVLYVFGDNVKREGRGGQAAEMRDEPNAVGVATKYAPWQCFGETPAEIAAQKRIIDRDFRPLFEHVRRGGIVVWPTDGIGTGLARLPELAPTTYDYIEAKLAALIRVSRLFDRGRHDEADALAKEHEDA